MSKKQIAITSLFTSVITYLALYFQWAEFYKGYSYGGFNLFISIIFLLAWLLFSFHFGKVQQKKYIKFIVVYWGINIISAIAILAFANNELIQAVLFPFYIWYGGPLYGFRYIFLESVRWSIDIPILMVITSPLGLLSCFTGYWYGDKKAKLKEHNFLW
ncbi:hypothetical protein [Clostridium folliculivorans]|uniref:hypothetical protein n=1 Tax=Clostridium folliculivorans TaxID=2886038 RepID=UPI0021C3A196|nr:hypothetical protein [Clostridium folliculivorans]GKU28635.1 hypothetical protein CFB3_07410 [Clostridium folliculivorans]